MRRIEGEATNGRRKTFLRRRRAPIAWTIALALLIAGLFADMPCGPPASDGIGPAAADCKRLDSRHSSDDLGGADCLGAICCAAGCGDLAPPGLAATRVFAPMRELAVCSARHPGVRILRIAAGWASAWSSRAPPRVA